MNEKLLAILLEWRERLQQRNMSSPPESDLRLIAASNRVWPTSSLSSVSEAWKATIQYLEKQQRFGVNDPLTHMDDEMWAVPPELRTSPMEAPAPERVDPVPVEAPSQAGPTEDDVVTAVISFLNALPPDSIPTVQEGRVRKMIAAGEANRSKPLASLGLAAYEDEINLVIRRAWANASVDVPSPPETAEAAPSAPRHSASANATEPVDVTAGPATTTEPTKSPERVALRGVDPNRFAPYDFTGGVPDPAQLSVVMTAGKSLQLSWHAPEITQNLQLYRIVAGEEEEPWSPESGRLVGVTSELDIEDTEVFSSAVRHLQVWCNVGSDVRSAQMAQPTCIAKRVVVCPVLDVSLREESGTVTGEWDVPEGIACVQVYRVPIDRVHHGSLSPMYRIEADEDNLGGFQDSGAERGKRYLYQFVAETEVDGVRLTSSPVVQEQLISVVLSRVADLAVRLFAEGEEQYFDISWTPPSTGRVVVFRSDHPPSPGVEDTIQEEARLEGAALFDKDRLAPVRRNVEPGRDGMRRVPWPDTWARAYFTPVTLHNGRALVGVTAAQTRVPGIIDGRIVERVNEQLLTFSWPRGAASVFVYVTRRNTLADGLDFTSMNHSYEISRDQWQSQGGFHFVPPLHLDGCALHLVAVAFQQGQTFRSTAYSVDYPGLRIVRYQTELKRSRLLLRMTSDTPTQMPEINFALVCNGERFPLDIKDGIPIPLTVADHDAVDPQPTVTPRWTPDGPSDLQWSADIGGMRGRYFFRLFADLPPERMTRVALIDPPIDQLLLDRR